VGRGRDERIGQAQVATATTSGRTPRAGQERRVRSRLDELDRLEEGGQMRKVRVPHPRAHLAAHDLVHDRVVAVHEQAGVPVDRIGQAPQVVDHERRIEHVAHASILRSRVGLLGAQCADPRDDILGRAPLRVVLCAQHACGPLDGLPQSRAAECVPRGVLDEPAATTLACDRIHL